MSYICRQCDLAIYDVIDIMISWCKINVIYFTRIYKTFTYYLNNFLIIWRSRPLSPLFLQLSKISSYVLFSQEFSFSRNFQSKRVHLEKSFRRRILFLHLAIPKTIVRQTKCNCELTENARRSCQTGHTSSSIWSAKSATSFLQRAESM